VSQHFVSPGHSLDDFGRPIFFYHWPQSKLERDSKTWKREFLNVRVTNITSGGHKQKGLNLYHIRYFAIDIAKYLILLSCRLAMEHLCALQLETALATLVTTWFTMADRRWRSRYRSSDQCILNGFRSPNATTGGSGNNLVSVSLFSISFQWWRQWQVFHSETTGKEYKIFCNVNCKTPNVVYLLDCHVCGSQYVGESVQPFNKRMNGHKSDLTKKTLLPASQHFIQVYMYTNLKRMRKCNDEVYQLAKDQALVKKLKKTKGLGRM
jgi:hypothetical protein